MLIELIDTTGQIKNGFKAGNLPKTALQRRAMPGWFVDRIPIDRRKTFFSKYGQWLDFCCALSLFLTIIAIPVERFIKAGKNEKVTKNAKPKTQK